MAKIFRAEQSDTSSAPWYSLTKVRLLWILILGIPILLGGAGGISLLFHYSNDLPSLDQLERIEPRLITKIFDRNGELVHEYYVEKRIWTPIDSISPLVPQAVMATEDRDFNDHWGMNLWAIPGAIIDAIFHKAKLRGASTLSQQLAKNLFLTPERSLGRKIKEAMVAVKIEQTYTKQEIMEQYLNQVYLGAGCYGFQSAVQEYFGNTLDSITPAQAATLAGMLQQPERLRPDRHPEASIKRRNLILKVMLNEGYIDQAQYISGIEEPIYTPTRDSISSAGAYFSEEIRKHMEKKHGESSLYSDGLEIHSTMDLSIQRTVEEAVQKQLESLQNDLKYRHARFLNLPAKFKMPLDSVVAHWDSVYALFDSIYMAPEKHRPDSMKRYPDSLQYKYLQTAAIVIENKTGAVLAMVGGKDFERSKFNRAIQSTRQPGSSFKPFVYAMAVDNGASPADSVNDQPITIPDPEHPEKSWRPANYEKKFDGFMTYRRALYRSKNLPAIQVAMDYGLNNLVNYANKFGLKQKFAAVPSLAIGSVGATLMEMTSAYTVFPNGGTRIEPYLIQDVTNRNGEVVEKNFKVAREVLSPQTAYILVDMLRDVNVRGTAAKIWASGFHVPSGGKTGTTNDYTDAWYIGFTPDYTMGVWIGQDNHRPMGRGHTGGQAAMPIWLETMQALYDTVKTYPEFKVPGGVVNKTLCKGTLLLAPEGCLDTFTDLFNARFAPTEYCDCSGSDLDLNRSVGNTFSVQEDAEGRQQGRSRKAF